MIQSNENDNQPAMPKMVLIAAGEPAAVKLALIRGILTSLLDYIHGQGYDFNGTGNPPLEFLKNNKHAPKAAADLIHHLFCITMAEELLENDGQIVINKTAAEPQLDPARN